MIKHILILLIFVAYGAFAQQPIVTGEDPRYPGTTGNSDNLGYDTLALKMARERASETNTVMERPINPDNYQIGPGDVLSISVPISKPLQFEAVVSPDAKLLVPTIGEIDLHNKTLSQSKKIIQNSVSKIFKAEASVSLRKMRQFKVYVIGAVIRTGVVLANPTTRVSDIIDLAGGAASKANKRSIRIFRDSKEIDVDLLPFYTKGNYDANPFVQGGDVVRLGVQDAKNVVSCFGAVQRPGEFSYKVGDSISSIIEYCFGFAAGALKDSIELVSVKNDGQISERYICRADEQDNIFINKSVKPGDRIFVRFVPNYLKSGRVVVKGEVNFQGSHAIEPGQTKLKDLIKQFGGFTQDASLTDVTIIRRKVLSEPDYEFGRILGIDPKDRSPEEVQYFRSKTREKRGVMSVNINALLNGKENENIVIEDDDSIFVPAKKTYIKLSGKIKNPGNVTYQKGFNYFDYIRVAGGYGWRADEDETQIIKGRTNEAFLASKQDEYEIEPGDAIFVPEKPAATFWKTFTEVIAVIAQIATIAAVIISITRPSSSSN